MDGPQSLGQESHPSRAGFAKGWGGVEMTWSSSAILGTAAVVIKGNGSPWSRAGNVRIRKLAKMGKKIWEAPRTVVVRGGGHWLAGAAVILGSVTYLLCDFRQGASPYRATFTWIWG